MELNDEKVYVSESMHAHGDKFVKKLGVALAYADDDNTAKIKATWPEYWQQYLKMAYEN
ncbi:MAG: hypothetical protein LBK68_03120 [Candidatus Margulisbacteria bacterium]|nr:hypothetical protein [Candidatus Margulisiibacteriota bacterium]